MTRATLYEQAMGADFSRLAPAVQSFHRLQGRVELHGTVETFAPRSLLARLIARGLGTPVQASAGPIRFELDATPPRESWTRHFPAHTMTSVLELDGAHAVERLGLAHLRFELLAMPDGRLSMKLASMRFAGIPCPRWLMPRIVAQEHGTSNVLNFEVSAALAWGDVVAQYRGHLTLPAGVSSGSPD